MNEFCGNGDDDGSVYEQDCVVEPEESETQPTPGPTTLPVAEIQLLRSRVTPTCPAGWTGTYSNCVPPTPVQTPTPPDDDRQ